MKYILLALTLFLGTTIVTQAAPFSWDYNGTFVRLLAPMNNKPVQVPSIQATSTTATSTFPVFYSATGTISNLNSTIVVDGIKYAKNGTGIQNAINDCAAQGGGEIFLPTGLYMVSASLVFPFESRCALRGTGLARSNAGGTELRAATNMDSLVSISGAPYASANSDLAHDNRFYQLYLNGDNKASTTLLLTNTDIVILDYVRLTGSDTNIKTVYTGIEPPSAGSKPGGLYIDHSIMGATASGTNIFLDSQTQVWITNTWIEATEAQAYNIVISESNKIHIDNMEFNSASTAVLLLDTATTSSQDITINNSVFNVECATCFNILDLRTNIASGRVSLSGNTYVTGTSSKIWNEGQIYLQDIKPQAGRDLNILVSGAGKVGIGTTTPLSTLEIVGGQGSPTLALTDFGGFFQGGADPAGRFFFQNNSDTLRLFRGTLGVSAGEIHRFTKDKDISNAISVQPKSVGVFTGVDAIYLSSSSSEPSFINNNAFFGIGTTTPSQRLHVAGGLRLDGAFLDSLNSTGTFGQLLQSNGTSTNWVSTSTLGILTGGGSNWSILPGGLRTSTSTDFVQAAYVVASSTTSTSTFAGRVAIGTTTALAPLHINDNNPSFILTDTAQTIPNGVFQWQSVSNTLRLFSGIIGVSGSEKIRITGNGSSGITLGPIAIQNLSGGVFTGTTLINLPVSGNSYFNNGGFVGIGTSAPSSTLHVVGTTTLATTSISLLTMGLLTPTRALFLDASRNATTTALSASLLNSLTDETGTSGGVVFAGSPTLTTPTFTTRATTAELAGGSAVSSSLLLKSTTGAGTSDFIGFVTGNNGARTAGRITTNAFWGFGTTTPASQFVFATSTATTTVSIDSGTTTRGACLEMKDSDGVGYTYITVNNGVMTASATSCK